MEIIKPAEFLSFLDRTLIGKLQSWLQGNGNQKIRGAVIGQAIILATVGIFLYKMMTPPAQLRHLPTINPLRLMYSFVSKEEPGSRANRLVLPTVLKHHSKGYVSTLVGKWTIIITDPVAARAFLLKTENFPKNQSILSMLEDSHPLVKFAGRSNIVFSNGEVWKNQRKTMNPPFHRAMPVDLFGNIMLKVYKKIDEHQGKPVVAIDIMERMTLDALSLGLFAFDFNALDDEDSPYVKTYERIRTDLRDPLVFIVPKLDSIVKYFRSSRERLVCDVDKLNKLLLDMANKRRQEIRDRRAQSADIPDSQKDLLTLIMEGELDGVLGLATNEELRANLAIFFLAGHETTANSLAFALYHLAKYPDVQRKARQEVINVLGDEHEDVLPTTEQLKQLKYIDMIIKENLRLTNPAAFINSRKALQEMYVGDVYIPKGASVTVDLTAIHRHPGIWDRPNDFIPERFAEGAEAERQKGLAWLPFSNGGRQCIGMNFSLAEQRVALSMLLRKYEWSLPEDSVHKDHLRIKHFAFMAPKDLTITFRNRY